MGKYYCGLCSESHHELIESASCPECGRKYCVDSIQNSIDVNKYECPYCDCPFEKFSIAQRFKEVISSKKISEGMREGESKEITYVKMSNPFKQILQFLERNRGEMLTSPRKMFSRGRRKPPMRFSIIEINNSKQHEKIQFEQILPDKEETELPLDYWRFELSLEYLEGKNFVPIGARLVNPPKGSLEYVLQEEEKRKKKKEGATKTAPHIADLLVLAGFAELDKVKSPISGRSVQAIRIIL